MQRLIFILFALCPLISAFSATLTHGPLVGRPQHDSMRIWVRTSEPCAFRVRFDRKPELGEASKVVEGRTSGDHDNTGTVELTGLQAAKTYFYAVEVDGKTTGGFSFRTWPSDKTFAHPVTNPQGLANTTIGIGVCNHIKGAAHTPVYRHLLEKHTKKLDLFIMDGDYIYEMKRMLIKPSEITTDSAREDYRSYLEGLPDMSRFMANTPMMWQFDDHEIGPEQATAEIGLAKDFPLLKTKASPVLRDVTLKAWREYCGWANPEMPAYRDILFGKATLKAGSSVLTDENADFSLVKPETTSTLHVHMGAANATIYAVDKVIDKTHLQIKPKAEFDETGASYSVGTHHYYDLKKGNAHLFVLDTRGERSLYRNNRMSDPKQKLLGDAQMQWLLDGVSKTEAQFIILVSPVPWTIWHNNSHMKGVALKPTDTKKEDGLIGTLAEREKLLNAFDALKKPVIILTGDLHSGYGVQITDNVWEFLVSPIASELHPLESGGNPPLQGRYDSNGREVNIKWASTFPMAFGKQFEAQGRRHGFVYGLIHINNIFPTGLDERGDTIWKAYDTPTLRMEIRDTETDDVVYAETISPADVR